MYDNSFIVSSVVSKKSELADYSFANRVVKVFKIAPFMSAILLVHVYFYDEEIHIGSLPSVKPNR